MSEYLSVHNNEGAYYAAANDLKTPHVAFLKAENELRYTKYTNDALANAKYGQILVTDGDVGSGTLSLFDTFTSADYENYTPTAICIFDRLSNPAGKAVFMSVSYMDYNEVGLPFHDEGSYMYWGCYNTDVSASVSNIRNESITSESINAEAK